MASGPERTQNDPAGLGRSRGSVRLAPSPDAYAERSGHPQLWPASGQHQSVRRTFLRAACGSTPPPTACAGRSCGSGTFLRVVHHPPGRVLRAQLGRSAKIAGAVVGTEGQTVKIAGAVVGTEGQTVKTAGALGEAGQDCGRSWDSAGSSQRYPSLSTDETGEMPLLIRAATAIGLLAALLWLAAGTGRRGRTATRRGTSCAVDVVMTVEPDGIVRVEETYQWDFRDRNGLGFYRGAHHRAGLRRDPGPALQYANIFVSSPSGAPAQVWVEQNWGGLAGLAVGAPGWLRRHPHRRPDVRALLRRSRPPQRRPRPGAGPGPRTSCTPTSSRISNPMERVTVTVTGPAEVIDVACYQGPFGSTTPCTDWCCDGETATFTAADPARGARVHDLGGVATGDLRRHRARPRGPLAVRLGAVGARRLGWA